MDLKTVIQTAKEKEIFHIESNSGKVLDLRTENFSQDDLFDTSWEVVKYFSFMEAIALMKKGKKMRSIVSPGTYFYIFKDDIVYNYINGTSSGYNAKADITLKKIENPWYISNIELVN